MPFKVNVYVINGIFDNVPLYCYNTSTNSIYIFNCSFYKVVYEIVIEATAKILREDRGFIIEKTMAVEKNKTTAVILGCGHPDYYCAGRFCSYCYKLVQAQLFKLQSLNCTAFRFAFKNISSGKFVSPIKAVMPDGTIKKGAELLDFFCECVQDENIYISNLNAVLSCLSPSDEKSEALLSNIDLKEGGEIFSYPIFKNYYQKTSTINHYPAAAYQFLHSKLENVPEITQEYMISHSQTLESFMRNELRGSKDASIAKYFNSISEEDGKKYVARFGCFEESYVLIDMAKLFGKVKIISNPFEYSNLKSIGILNAIDVKEKIESAVFLKKMPDDRLKEKAGASPLLKYTSALCSKNISICELNIFDEIKFDENDKDSDLRAIYEETIKKLFTIEINNPNSGVIIDGLNYKSLFPPPPASPPPPPKT